ncbi:hypothetical protein Bca52824_089801 [Brassica carinata]|uniref:Uncharacterized protein n=1 Tax=Brassica carinata TaxID=52824 RepID=A0A8X7TG15_BRACI|nr:hypothetical protein Bca52824_089801 [Brassica carinata]
MSSYAQQSVKEVMKKLQEYVDDINTNIENLATRGPVSKYVLQYEDLRGRLTLSFDEASAGVACNLDSRGFHVLCNATKEVVGHVKPYSITGLMATYHAKNEYCLLTDMYQGFDVIVRIISQLEQD